MNHSKNLQDLDLASRLLIDVPTLAIHGHQEITKGQALGGLNILGSEDLHRILDILVGFIYMHILL